jgi:hypothetical protein
MGTPTRAMTMLIAAAAAGALIWYAGRFDGTTSHDYWISLGLIAAAGLIVGIAVRAYSAQAAASLIAALVPLLVTIWIALATQPTGGHVANWSHDLGIGGVVGDLGVHVSVLAFGACVMLATAAGLPGLRRVPATADREPGTTPAETERISAGPEPTLRTSP